jgi:hypothetical protein
VDRFGNCQTNVGPDELIQVGVSSGGDVTVQIGATSHALPWRNSYSDAAEGEALLHVDSAGLIAIAVNGGSASDVFRLSDGVPVTLRPA